MYNILITDAESRKTLSVIRSIGKLNNCKVFAVSKYSLAIGSHSKYVEEHFKVKEYTEESLAYIVEKTNADLIMPCSEETVEIVSKSEMLKNKVVAPVPTFNAFRICRDKSLTINFARDLGVKCPETMYATEVEDLLEKLSSRASDDFPLLVKPIKSSGSRGLRLIDTKESIDKTLIDVWSNYEGFLIQELIPLEGVIVDAVFLYKDGEKIAEFSDRRLRTYPPKMGACTFGVSSYDEEALEIGGKLLDELSWNGFAQVEFRLNPKDGDLYLMEINPRLWGSVQLPIFAGIDFPKIMIDAFLENREIVSKEVVYQKGVYFRWFADYLSILSDKTTVSAKLQQIKKPKGKLTTQILDYHDFLPGFFFLLNGLTSLLSPYYWRKNIKSERL